MVAIFDNVHYFLSSSLSPQRRLDLSTLLQTNGAIEASIQDATHIIANTNKFEGWQSVKDNVAVVTERWVERSMILGKLQLTQYYSTDPRMIFSGIVACAADLPTSDLEILSAGITSLGGQFRMGFTRDVTHLFALSPSSVKYQTALHFRDHTNVKIILPHWFDDSVRLGYAALETELYEWPNPKILDKTSAENDPDRAERRDGKALPPSLHRSPRTKDLIGTEKDVWNGRKILLGSTLQLSGRTKEAIEAGVKRSGGVIVESDVENADILVTRFRYGKVYLRALQLKKTIGSLAWLFHVQSTGIFASPTDQLLHYPYHKRPIEGFSSHVISVTNYTGESRDYLKKLIAAMGACFTPSMSAKNTVLVAAYISGTKATKARAWSIPVVNHTWLEDCFIQWRMLTLALEKYVVFPDGMDFSTVLGLKGVVGVERDLEDKDLAEEDDPEDPVGDTEEDDLPLDKDLKPQQKTKSQAPPAGPTQNSMKDVREVAELIDDAETGHAEDEVGTSSPQREGQRRSTPHRDAVTSPGGAQKKTRMHVGPLNRRRTRIRSPADIESEDDDPSDNLNAKAPRAARSKPKPATAEPQSHTRDTRDIKGKASVKQPSSSRPASGGADIASESSQPPPSSTRQARRKDADEKSISISSDEEQSLPRNKPFTRKGPPKGISPTEPSSDLDLPADVRVMDAKKKEKEKEKKSAVSATGPATPKRVMSVVVPPSPYHVSPKKSTASPGHKGKEIARTESVRITAHEANIASRSPLRTSARVKDGATEFGPLTRTPSKRTAAGKAANKLKNEVMPDVMKFQLEMRRTKDRRKSGGPDWDENSFHPSKRTDLSESEALLSGSERKTGKKRRITEEVTDEESDNVLQDDILLPPRRKGRYRTTQDEESSEAGGAGTRVARLDKHARPESSGNQKKTRATPTLVKNIRMMTTGFTLDDSVLKVLAKLGVKITTKPSECTHLVAPRLLRTEKFLCALAAAPYILRSEWATVSADKRELQSEEDYLLADEDNERKHEFKLSEAIQRAKENRGRLLAKKVFYITPKVSVDSGLLKNVITAFGGQLLTQSITERMLRNNRDRHVISCQDDERIWRPLAQDYPIYSQELILTGVLRQRIDWDDVDFQVPGSY